MDVDDIQAMLMYSKFGIELHNEDEDDDSIQKFKIKLDQLI